MIDDRGLPDNPLQRLDSLVELLLAVPCLVPDLRPVVVNSIGGIMQKQGYLAGVRYPHLDEGEYPEFRSQDIIRLWIYARTILQKTVELVHEIRIEVHECPVEHLVELLYILINRGKRLYLRDKVSRSSPADIPQDMVLILPGSVDVLRQDAEELCDIFLLHLVSLPEAFVQCHNLLVDIDEVAVLVLYLYIRPRQLEPCLIEQLLPLEYEQEQQDKDSRKRRHRYHHNHHHPLLPFRLLLVGPLYFREYPCHLPRTQLAVERNRIPSLLSRLN